MLRKAASLFCFVLTTNRQYDKLNRNYGVEGDKASPGLCCGKQQEDTFSRQR